MFILLHLEKNAEYEALFNGTIYDDYDLSDISYTYLDTYTIFKDKQLQGNRLFHYIIDFLNATYINVEKYGDDIYYFATYLRNYVDKMDENTIFRNPDVFYLYIQRVRDFELTFLTPETKLNAKDIFISFAEPVTMLKNDENRKNPLEKSFIDDFSDFIDDTYQNRQVETYLLTINEEDSYLHIFNTAISEMYFILQRGWTIKKCANCGKYFVNRNRTDIKYCQNPAPLDRTKTCREYAATRGYYLNIQRDELQKLRAKLRTRLNKRAIRDNMYKADFDEFLKTDKQWKQAAKTDLNKKDDYYEWLKSVDNISSKSGGKVANAEPKPNGGENNG